MSNIIEIMTKNPVCCTPEMGLPEVAQLMLKYDCGEIPVVYSLAEKKVLGVITDRDIVARSVAVGVNPMAMSAEECMTYPAIIVKNTISIEDCCQIMEENQIRRIPVVDEKENCCGVVSIADIARYKKDHLTLEVIKNISRPHSNSLRH
ncbi:MAG: CBS domain-containing protein [Bacteriovorax sp.]|nr:CBS domain-containing protein [Bacteriovorax sp.]